MSQNNPYQSPPEVKGPSSKERKLEALIVKYFRQCRERPPTWLSLWRRFLPYVGIQILFIAGIILVASIIVPSAYLAHIGILSVGMILGSWLRDLGFCRKIALQWPVLEQLLDWDKIERKHEEHGS